MASDAEYSRLRDSDDEGTGSIFTLRRFCRCSCSREQIFARIQLICSLKKLGCCFIFSLLIAFLVPVLIKIQINEGIRDNVVIDSREAGGFKQFEDRSHSGNDRTEFFFFNITNPHAVLKGEKPHLQELGPFVYDSFQHRSGFIWNTDTLAYREHTWYRFNKEKTLKRSNGRFNTDNIQITTFNMIFLGMRAKIGMELLDTVCTSLFWINDFKRLFTKRTVRELLTGYSVHVPVLGAPIKFPGFWPNSTRRHDADYQKKTVMKVGSKNIDKAFEIVEWRNSKTLKVECPFGANPLSSKRYCRKYFPCCQNHSIVPRKNMNMVSPWGKQKYRSQQVWDEDANRVIGRNGEQFSPRIKRGDSVLVFNDHLARSLKFVNKAERSVNEKGIRLLRFTPTESNFQNSSSFPPNERFYLFGPNGILANISILNDGAPIFVSFPHFLYGDNSLKTDVVGLSPDEEKHQMFIDIEPTLGTTMEEHARTQINTRLFKGKDWGVRKYKHWFKDVQDKTFVPIFWFDMIAEISDDGVRDFKQLYIADDAVLILEIVGMVSLVLSSFGVVGILCCRKFG
eukprot:CAMPEP_0184011238 /NCGR_PEP_ID=MMETSP0954-20121128/3707_1 /TAXON_ID=627963 /ORGANISM="Aplanochytrium sp, Strain PBS07" /LENGTH=566 /DNA_ID=CAMNT_0026291015 /DNA_START=92 /DNA_END=1792 /DNA_ORIENTATION=-